MGDVVSFDPLRLSPHIVGSAECMNCGYCWVAVYPYEEEDSDGSLECPHCGLMAGVRQ